MKNYDIWFLNLRCHRHDIFGHFSPFQPPNNLENENFKIEKNTIILHICTHHKWQSLDAWFPRYGVWQNFLSLWAIFCPFTPLGIQKIKILKNWKNPWRYYPFTNAYHKWQSYDVWFLRYGVQRTEFFCHFGPFFTLLPH